MKAAIYMYIHLVLKLGKYKPAIATRHWEEL